MRKDYREPRTVWVHTYARGSYERTLIILCFSKLVTSDQHGLVMLSLGYLIYVPSMCQL